MPPHAAMPPRLNATKMADPVAATAAALAPHLAAAQLRHLESTPLSDDDLRRLLGRDIRISTLPQLATMTDISQALDAKGRGIVLELTTGPNNGHWIALLRHPGSIEVFSSYGTPPGWDVDHWLTQRKRRQLGEDGGDLVRLLHKAQADEGLAVSYNSTDFQHASADCGRWRCSGAAAAGPPVDAAVSCRHQKVGPGPRCLGDGGHAAPAGEVVTKRHGGTGWRA